MGEGGDTFDTFDLVLVLGKLCPDLLSVPGRGSHQGVRPTLGKTDGVSLVAEAWLVLPMTTSKGTHFDLFSKVSLKVKEPTAALIPSGPNHLH